MEVKPVLELEKGKIYVLKGGEGDANNDAIGEVAHKVGCSFLIMRSGESIEEYKDVALKMIVLDLMDEIENTQLDLEDKLEQIRERFRKE